MMAKKIVSITLDTTPAKATKLQNAVEVLAEYLDDIGKAWKHLSPEQRRAVRLKYPVIDLFIETGRPFFVHRFGKTQEEQE